MDYSIFMKAIIMAAGIFLGALVVGLFIIAWSDIILAVREIALNTRKEPKRVEYRALEIVARIYAWLGWIIIIGGLVVASFVVFAAL